MNLQGLGREAIVTYVEALSWRVHRGTEKTMKNLRILGYSGQESNQAPSSTNQKCLVTPHNQSSIVSIARRLWSARSGVQIWAGERVFFISKMLRPALGPTQPPTQWVPGFSRSKAGRT